MASAQIPAAPRPAAKVSSKRRRPSGPLKIVDAYLFSQVFEATLLGLVRFGGLLLAVTAIGAVRKFITSGISFEGMLQMVFYQMPRIILFTLPCSVLFGVVQAFTELSTENEITALSAGGMSLPRMMSAPVCWGAFLTFVAFVLQEAVVPGSQMRVDAVALSKMGVVGAGKFQWVDPPPGKGPVKRVIQAQRLDVSKGILIRPRIQIYNSSGLVRAQIEAERGQWDLKSNNWKFLNGSTSYYGRGIFGAWVTKGSSKFDVIKNDEVQAPALGKLTRNNTDARSALDKNDYEYVSLSQVKSYRREMQRESSEAKTSAERALAAKQVKSATYGIHDKIATPLVVLGMVLVGAPLGLRPPRAKGQGAAAMGITALVLIAYYVTWSWCTAVGKNGYGDPLMLAYLPVALTFFVGAFLVVKKSQ